MRCMLGIVVFGVLGLCLGIVGIVCICCVIVCVVLFAFGYLLYCLYIVGVYMLGLLVLCYGVMRYCCSTCVAFVFVVPVSANKKRQSLEIAIQSGMRFDLYLTV